MSIYRINPAGVETLQRLGNTYEVEDEYLVLIGEDVTDTDGSYSITMEVTGMDKELVLFRVDGYPTQQATSIKEHWYPQNKDPLKYDLHWPNDWRPKDRIQDYSVLSASYARAAYAPTITAPVDEEPTAMPAETGPKATEEAED